MKEEYDILGVHRGKCTGRKCNCMRFTCIKDIMCDVCKHPPTWHETLSDITTPCTENGCSCNYYFPQKGKKANYCAYCGHVNKKHEGLCNNKEELKLESVQSSAEKTNDSLGKNSVENVESNEPELCCPICNARSSLFSDQSCFEQHVDWCCNVPDHAREEMEEIQRGTGKLMAEVVAVYRVAPIKVNDESHDRKEDIIETLERGIDLQLWLSKRPEPPEHCCQICRAYHQFEDMVSLNECGHEFGKECLMGYAKSRIEGNSIVICPHMEGSRRCYHVIDTNEIKEILGAEDPSVQNYSELLLNDAFNKMGDIVICPKEGCEYKVAVDRGVWRPVGCEICGYIFCHMCNREYHYRCSCTESLQHEQSWMAWNSHRRVAYHSSKQRVSDYHQHEAQMKRRNEEIQGRFDELVADERWKEENCRVCPHCGRCVNKLEGCNLMVCGWDIDTGSNVQSGCGQKFRWCDVQPYKSALPSSANLEELRMEKPPDTCTTVHAEYQCVNCNKEIIGLRFSCIQCVSYDLCEECEYKVTHERGHVFRILNHLE